MAGDDFWRFQFGVFFLENFYCFVGDVFMAGSVEAIAADMVFSVKFLRNGIEIGFFRHCLVKSGIENSYLFGFWQEFLAGFD